MPEPQDALISIHGIHARRILGGTKTVELRRRFPAMTAESRLWIYETLPTGAVIGFATVAGIDRGIPEVLWERYGPSIGVESEDFMAYLNGCVEAVAILLTKVREVAPIPAATLRAIRDQFHPPQVMIKLTLAEGIALRRIAGSGVSIQSIGQTHYRPSNQIVRTIHE